MKKVDLFLLGGQHENFVAAVTKEKCERSTIKYKVKMSGSEKSEREHVRLFLHKSVTKKFLEVSRPSRAKQRQRNVQKSVLHVQSCFFAN